MKLYFSKGACSLAIRIIIHEIGIDCEYEAVNLKTKQTERGTDYLKVNPKGAVPALLIESDILLTENVVIQQYLAEKYNATALLPREMNLERYRILEALTFVSSDLHRLFGVLFNSNVPDETKKNVFMPLLKAKLRYTDDKLAQHQYLAADHFTLADSYLFVVLLWTHHFSIDLAEYPRLFDYVKRLRERASVVKSLEEEGIP